MRWSKMFIPTLRESPAKEAGRAFSLMARAGYAFVERGSVAAYLPLGSRTVRRIRELVRKRLMEAGAQEFCFGVPENREDSLAAAARASSAPAQGAAGEARSEAEGLLWRIASSHLRSYRELPQVWFDFAGDPDATQGCGGRCVAYHLSLRAVPGGAAGGDPARTALSSVIEECGLKTMTAHGPTIPGREEAATELVYLHQDGEVGLAHCPCGYAANIVCAVSKAPASPQAEPPATQSRLVETPDKRTIADVCEFLSVPAASLIKSLLYIVAGKPLLALVRGDDQLNECLLCRAAGSSDARPANADEVKALFGAEPGSIGPVGTTGVRVLADHLIRDGRQMVCGANKDDYHLTGVEPERDFRAEYVHLRQVREGDPCPECGQPLSVARAHSLLRSAALLRPLHVLGPNNKHQAVSVRSHKLDLDALLISLIEQFSDDDGIVLPRGIAPFDVVITPISYADSAQKEVSDRLHDYLTDQGMDALLDDRDCSPGVKFKDADLVGIPLRITVGPKKLKEGKLELRSRRTRESCDCKVEEVTQPILRRMIA
jgi:prolyl-tRNA synthetase